MEIRYQINDIEQVAKTVLEEVHSKTILFYGEMGVGKTTLIKTLVKALGSNDSVSSPTFSIVNEYLLESGCIYHFDFYRIEDEDEALNFGVEDYLYSNEWILMEWPEKISSLLPEDAVIIEIVKDNNGHRTLKLTQNIKLTGQNSMKPQNFL
ncbi:tRNA (adenosine(37)-N6)-threonylcarbamoyltransferase complex ATPase subunit type 1 TsaE [Mangrovimonas sp. YM274]|uniref:tRNA (adenosine(37)-N6)-threonylcarbamoyltransferase complex ATPase subunit type 1 TsaE n=1 Tax=Mangrovimonas sp. YM274 TaxID=3070660 RepID=UPI0027DDF26A|nr:tRNA (adenosine(37)-N6)-threonylcarbamoyltransferase complex ATPase subunit type 1 TsaE [Mangrovimonas sp. YM274]WMI67281.1 tRNA (adenosine(37)-N6)-threonylcarbamoyltransferase complex ATPase subunit type 1 TsaE [Mangrovimonas sp. YM274]